MLKSNTENVKKAKIALLSMQRHSWEQGVAMQAFLEQGDMDIVITMAKEAAYRSMPDGRMAIMGDVTSVTDPCSVGEALHAAVKATQDDMLTSAYDKLLDWALYKAPRNEAGIVFHFDDLTQFWIDSMYMLPPFLADAGYYKESLRQIDGYWSVLYHPEKKMLSHMWDDAAKSYVRKDIWGVGNGWALAGMTRVIAMLPEEFMQDKLRLQQRVQALLDEILPYMEPNGMFHDVIDNPDSFLEINLSQMIAYTIYRGVSAGWLPDTYLVKANLLCNAANGQVDPYGLVQNVCGAPHFDKPGVAPEGQAFYLLMEACLK